MTTRICGAAALVSLCSLNGSKLISERYYMNDHNRGLGAAKPGALRHSRGGQAEWPKQPLSVTRGRAGSVMFSSMAWNEIARSLGLSVRELQIVRGTFDDQTESAIATELHICLGTVHTHIERLHHKLAVADRAQLILRVVQEYMALTAPHSNPLLPAHRSASAITRSR